MHKTMTLDEVNVYLNNLNREHLRKNPTQDVVMGGKSYWKDAKVTHSPAFLKWLFDEESEEPQIEVTKMTTKITKAKSLFK